MTPFRHIKQHLACQHDNMLACQQELVSVTKTLYVSKSALRYDNLNNSMSASLQHVLETCSTT